MSYGCLNVCVPAGVWMNVLVWERVAHACASLWRPGAGTRHLPLSQSTFFVESGSLNRTQSPHTQLAAPGIVSPLPGAGITGGCHPPGTYMGARDPNPGPRTGSAKPFVPKPFLQPSCLLQPCFPGIVPVSSLSTTLPMMSEASLKRPTRLRLPHSVREPCELRDK